MENPEIREIHGSVIVKLIDWLKAHGFSAEDILDCIQYIAKNKEA